MKRKQERIIYDLIYERELYDEYKKEIEYLIEIKNIIKIFLELLKSDKNELFINLEKYNFKKLGNIIIDFINKNSKKLGDLQKQNNSIDIFINFIIYYSNRRDLFSFQSFENFILKNIDNLKSDKKDDIFAFIGEDIFWNKILQEINNFFNDLIEDLEYEIAMLEGGNILEGIKEDIGDLVQQALDLNNGIYKQSFEDILNFLYFNKEITIAVILDDYDLLENNEKLYNFILSNYEKFSKIKDGKKVCDFIIKLNENSFSKSLSELISDLQIGYIELLQFTYKFEELLKVNK